MSLQLGHPCKINMSMKFLLIASFIFSDSQAAILALDNSEMTSQLVRETKLILNKLEIQRLSVV